ncbi:MAG: ABC transporter ATP-binding protein [Lentisphaerae bacterium]|nr:ABC transporter ATP-binding protein [Lentisphaerota bacterium]
MGNAVEFVNVSAGYHGTILLNNLTATVSEGQIVSIIGPNGAGKTTILRTITGLIHPAAGSVLLFGANVATMPSSTRARLVGVIPQNFDNPTAFTVEEIVMTGRTAMLNRWRQPSLKDRIAVERAMVYTDIVDMRRRPLVELSGGERQRTVIAMVLAQSPKLILMDEATSNLDMNHKLEIMQIVERLNRENGTTIIMVSHDLNIASEFSQQLLLIDKGRLVISGTPTEVLKENLLRRVYHCNVYVHQNSNGSISVSPEPRLTTHHSGKGQRIHVISGGGTGEELIRRLALCEYNVTCGVLNEGDSDAEVAAALNIDTALENPFSPIGKTALTKAEQMLQSAETIVICGVPFGTGNLANLKLAAQALNQGKRVLAMAGIEDRDYTPSKEAQRIVAELKTKGILFWNTMTDLLDMLNTQIQNQAT